MEKVKLIHIGKCGGTTLVETLGLKEIHLTKANPQPNTKYIIWVRNPIKRFVSAFNFSKGIIDTDTTNLNPNNLNLNNCLAPYWVKRKMLYNMVFHPHYDNLIKTFKTANHLAESLTSNNEELKNKAYKLMSFPMEHIHFGIGWYLNGGKFIEENNEKILFVGTVENMKEDFNKLCELLDIKKEYTHMRRNSKKMDKSLTKISIENIINYYKKDYKTLKVLNKFGHLTDDYIKNSTLYT